MESRHLVSDSKATGLETLNFAKKGYSKISINQRFFVVFAGKKQPNQVGKMPEIWKKINLQAITTHFLKNR